MIVIGAGRVGGALAQRDPDRFRLIDRERGWEQLDNPAARGEAIVLAVRNDALPEVLARIPSERRDDLVFIQNGMLRPWLREVGLEGTTRGLLFLAVPSRGAPIEPGGESPFTGPRAAAVVEAFQACGLPASVVDEPRFRAIELEKLIWNSAFGLLCETEACDVGTVVEDHRALLAGLVDEMLCVGEQALEVELELEPLVERLCVYSRSIPSYRGAVKEWRWRNGWFVDTAAAQTRATPIHTRLLALIGR